MKKNKEQIIREQQAQFLDVNLTYAEKLELAYHNHLSLNTVNNYLKGKIGSIILGEKLLRDIKKLSDK
jgi:hypothetical protein